MNINDQHTESESLHGKGSNSDFAARTGTCKPKTKEVKARYMHCQPVSTGPRHNGISTGRSSRAAYHSAGWVELQLPNHASTPLMMNTAGSSTVFTESSKPRRMQQAPAPRTAQRSLQQTALLQQRQQQQPRQQQKVELGTSSAQQQHTPAAPPGAQCLQHDITPLADTARHASGAGAPSGALISPGSSRSSTSCSHRQGREFEPAAVAVQSCQHTATMEVQTPQVSRLSASMVVGSRSALHPARLGMSAGVGLALNTATTAHKAAAERKSKLEEFLQQKKLQKQQVPKGAPVGESSSQSSFREPAPKTMFKATAVVRGVSRLPASARSAAGSTTAAISCTSGSMPSPAATVGGTAAAVSPGSAFKATMATLQQTGGGSKVGRMSSSGKAPGSKALRPSCVPVLPLDWMQHQGGEGCCTPQRTSGQQQQLKRLSLPALATTRIPTLDFSAVSLQQQQQDELSVPLSSRHISNAAHVPLPDATPRTFRDAPPSRLPKTPRGTLQASAAAAPGPQLGGLQAASPAAPAGTDSMPSRHRAAGGTRATSKTPCVVCSPNVVKPSNSTPASIAATAGHQAFSSTGVAREPYNSTAALQRPAKTPRGHVTPSAAVGASIPASPRPHTSSSAIVPSVSMSATDPAVDVKRTDHEWIEEVRQQLRLLRMQHLQIRHLTARVEAAIKARKGKAETIAAAAAAAVIERSGELLAMKGHLVREQWSSKLTKLLQHQLPLLRAWARLQVQHTGHVTKLQMSCKAALSHVPLHRGAAVGHHPEAPDLELLQRQLVHGMQLLQEAGPALQQLLGPDLTAVSSSRGAGSSQGATVAAGSTQELSAEDSGQQTSSSSSGTVQKQQLGLLSNSINTTAALAEQLMSVAAQECCVLSQLSQQLAQLSDLHLYANSMQVQLAQMKEATPL